MSQTDRPNMLIDTQLAAWQSATLAVLSTRKIGATAPDALRVAKAVFRLQPGATLAWGHQSSESFDQALQMLSDD